MVSTSAPPPWPLKFNAPTLTANTPASRGVPVIRPDPVTTLSPAGNPVAVKLKGVRLAVMA